MLRVGIDGDEALKEALEEKPKDLDDALRLCDGKALDDGAAAARAGTFKNLTPFVLERLRKLARNRGIDVTISELIADAKLTENFGRTKGPRYLKATFAVYVYYLITYKFPGLSTTSTPY